MTRILKLIALLCLCVRFSSAQETQALRQSYHAPKADVEQALKDINAYQSSRLPFLEGFVGSIDEPLNQFQRPSYQYAIDVQQLSDSEVSVSVNAKISAWHEDSNPSKSGYRELPSSGRLEEDLLARLSDRLHQHAAEVAASRVPLVSPKLLGTTESPLPTAPAGTPETASPSKFSDYSGAVRPTPARSSADPNPRYERLLREENSLKEVLGAQQHPQDLVAVRSAHTAVRAAPTPGSRLLFYADAEDEFQFLKKDGEWVHVQISGLNRGWIQASQLENVGATANPSPAKAETSQSFLETKEETSTFPGDWQPLRGKKVKIIWVKPQGSSTQKSRLYFAQSLWKKQAPEVRDGTVDGVVVVFDAAEGGMAAATTASLHQWTSGALTDTAFLQQCWFEPADAFVSPAGRN